MTRPDTTHPSLGLGEDRQPLTFRDYYERNKSKVPTEPTEEQLAFRNHVQSGVRLTVDPGDPAVESESEPDAVAVSFVAPEADVPEF